MLNKFSFSRCLVIPVDWAKLKFFLLFSRQGLSDEKRRWNVAIRTTTAIVRRFRDAKGRKKAASQSQSLCLDDCTWLALSSSTDQPGGSCISLHYSFVFEIFSSILSMNRPLSVAYANSSPWDDMLICADMKQKQFWPVYFSVLPMVSSRLFRNMSDSLIYCIGQYKKRK